MNIEKLSIIVIFWLLNLTFYFFAIVLLYYHYKNKKKVRKNDGIESFYTYALKYDKAFTIQIKIRAKTEANARVILGNFVNTKFSNYYIYKIETYEKN